MLSASILFAQNKNIYILAHNYESAYSEDFDYINNLGTAFDYFEFKGYVRAVLDSSNKYDECKESLQVKEIAHRAAIVIGSLKKQEQDEYISALAAVNVACNIK